MLRLENEATCSSRRASDVPALDPRLAAYVGHYRSWSPWFTTFRIVARGVRAGPAVARILQTVEARWLAENFPDAARAAALLDAVLAEEDDGLRE